MGPQNISFSMEKLLHLFGNMNGNIVLLEQQIMPVSIQEWNEVVEKKDRVIDCFHRSRFCFPKTSPCDLAADFLSDWLVQLR